MKIIPIKTIAFGLLCLFQASQIANANIIVGATSGLESGGAAGVRTGGYPTEVWKIRDRPGYQSSPQPYCYTGTNGQTYCDPEYTY